MKKTFCVVLIIFLIIWFFILFFKNLEQDNNKISEIDYRELDNISNSKKDAIIIISGRGCCFCVEAKKAVKKSFHNHKFELFKEIEYENLRPNKLINKTDLRDGIPLTLVIKSGIVVERILGFYEEIYIPKLDSLITANYK